MLRFSYYAHLIPDNLSSEVFLKNSQRSPFQIMLQTIFTRRALKGHCTWTFKGHSRDIQKVLQHCKCIPRALQGQFKAPRHSNNWDTRHSKGTQALGYSGHLGTWAPRHMGTWVLQGNLGTRDICGTLFSRFLRWSWGVHSFYVSFHYLHLK